MWLRHAAVTAALFLVTAPVVWLGGGLDRVETGDSSALLPPGCEAGAVAAESHRFAGLDEPSVILVYTRPNGPITDDDRGRIAATLSALTDRFGLPLTETSTDRPESTDRTPAEVVVRLAGPARPGYALDALRAKAGQVPDLHLEMLVPAPSNDIDTGRHGWAAPLLALGAVAAIVLLGYRSCALALAVLGTVGVAVGVTDGVTYLLAAHGVLTVTDDTLVLLNIVVLTAGTDYALLLAAAYRKALRAGTDRYAAASTAVRTRALPIAAGAASVMSGLLCLRAAALGSTRASGPLLALGVDCAALFTLVLLPHLLALAGPHALGRPRPSAGAARAPTTGVRARSWMNWVLAAMVLSVLVGGVALLRTPGTRATSGYDVTPIVVTTNRDRLDAVLQSARLVGGVDAAEPYLTRGPIVSGPENKGQPGSQPMVVDGRAAVLVLVGTRPDSAATSAVAERLRAVLHAVQGADARVGGHPAADLDLQRVAWRDRFVVVPLALGVVLALLILLSRRVVASAALVASLTLSFLATLGGCQLVSSWLGLSAVDDTFPVSVFVVLVALTLGRGIVQVTGTGSRGRRLRPTRPTLATVGVGCATALIARAVPSLDSAVMPVVAVTVAVILDSVIRAVLVPARAADPGTVAAGIPTQRGRRRTGKHHISSCQ